MNDQGPESHLMNGATVNRFFSPTTPHGALLAMARTRMNRIKREERGASAIEFVIITAVLVALAALVGWAIYEMVQGEADSLDVPDLPG